MRKCSAMAPGAYPHTDVAIGADFAPVVKTGFGIQLPTQGAVEFLLIPQRDRIGGTTVCAFFANFAVAILEFFTAKKFLSITMIR